MQKTKRREWVKTFAIIFLVILLILTFFSNDIMNRSLPEVAVQSVESGTINAIIRGTGAVSADETYDVTINQTRKVRSVLVKVGDVVSAGDTLLLLEAMDSEELKTAQSELATMELNYQKSLIEASNASSTENREIQKYRDAYNEALAVLRLYSNADPTQITLALKTAEANLTAQKQVTQDANNRYQEALNDEDYTAAQAQVTALEGEMTTLQANIDTLNEQLGTLSGTDEQTYLDGLAKAYTTLSEQYQKRKDLEDQISALQSGGSASPDGEDGGTTLEDLNKQLQELNREIERDEILYRDDYDLVLMYAGQSDAVAAAYATDTSLLRQAIIQQDGGIRVDHSAEYDKVTAQIAEATQKLRQTSAEYTNYKAFVEDWKQEIEKRKNVYDLAQKEENRMTDEVTNLTAASTAAESLKAAETALEDKVFEASLGDSGSLDLKSSKEAIEKQRKLVEELTANADGQEVKANVGGKISAINVTAGNSAGADTALATITVADRGYTVKIPVTADQAKKVTVGDVATITNYYNGDITATLENIANDPQNPGKGKLLVFRLTGEGVEAGANITLSIGQKSATYDCLVPNSALRNDSNGDFVLVVQAKSTPLGNRYVATRVGVTILAQDDTKTAISGLSSGDFVITTSTAPIEAGAQVRLVDNG